MCRSNSCLLLLNIGINKNFQPFLMSYIISVTIGKQILFGMLAYQDILLCHLITEKAYA